MAAAVEGDKGGVADFSDLGSPMAATYPKPPDGTTKKTEGAGSDSHNSEETLVYTPTTRLDSPRGGGAAAALELSSADDIAITRALAAELAAVGGAREEDTTTRPPVDYSRDLLTLTWDETRLATPYVLTPQEYYLLSNYLSWLLFYYASSIDTSAKRVLTELDSALSEPQKEALGQCKRSRGFIGPIDAFNFSVLDEIYRQLTELKSRAGKPGLEFFGYKPFGEDKPLALEDIGGRIAIEPYTGDEPEKILTDLSRGENYFGTTGRICYGESAEFIKAWLSDALIKSGETCDAEVAKLNRLYRQEMQNAALLPLNSIPPFNFTHERYLDGLSSQTRRMCLMRDAAGNYGFTVCHTVFDISSTLDPTGSNPVDYWVTQTFKEGILASGEKRFELMSFSIGGSDAEVMYSFFQQNLAIAARDEGPDPMAKDKKFKDIYGNQSLLHLAIKKRSQLLRKLFPRPDDNLGTTESKAALIKHRELVKLISLYHFLPPEFIPESKRTIYEGKLTEPFMYKALKIQEATAITPVDAAFMDRIIEVVKAIETIPAVTVLPHEIRTTFGQLFLTLCQKKGIAVPISYLTHVLQAFQNEDVPLAKQLLFLKVAVETCHHLTALIPSTQLVKMLNLMQSLGVPNSQQLQCVRLCLDVYNNKPRAEINLLKFILDAHKENLPSKLKEIAYALTDCFDAAEAKRFETALDRLYTNGSQMTRPGFIEYTLYQAFKRKEVEGFWARITLAAPARDPEYLTALNILATYTQKPIANISTTPVAHHILKGSTSEANAAAPLRRVEI